MSEWTNTRSGDMTPTNPGPFYIGDVWPNREYVYPFYKPYEVTRISDTEWFATPDDADRLAKKYRETVLSDDEKLAIEMGAMDENGGVTEAGKELLASMLFSDQDVKRIFFKTLRDLHEDEQKSKIREKSGSKKI